MKGVVESDDLKYTNKEELLQEMKGKGIMDCFFFQKKQTNGDLTNTGRVVLTFRGQQLPYSVRFTDCLNCRVRKYIPDPLRCFKCQGYGHTSLSCRGKKKCAKCGELYHENCNNPSKCLNCGGAHTAFDKKCPKWITEKEIAKVRVLQDIPETQARAQVRFREESRTLSYAGAVRGQSELEVRKFQQQVSLLMEKMQHTEGKTSEEIPELQSEHSDEETRHSSQVSEVASHQESQRTSERPSITSKRPRSASADTREKDNAWDGAPPDYLGICHDRYEVRSIRRKVEIMDDERERQKKEEETWRKKKRKTEYR